MWLAMGSFCITLHHEANADDKVTIISECVKTAILTHSGGEEADKEESEDQGIDYQ